jgi:hypothetical protein
MATKIKLEPVKTYATEANAIKAVEKLIKPELLPELRYLIYPHTDGRFFPVFIGLNALDHGVHFHFNILA